MIQKPSDKVWTDHKGQEVPREYVDGFDVRKERTVGKLLKKAEKLSKELEAFKQMAFDDVDRIYDEMLKKADINPSERKGNFTLYSFDKSVKMTVDVSERIEFDENINFAQQKINEYLVEKTKGADQELAVLVNNAFKTTKGRLDTKRIFSLFTLKITHPLWTAAMELIKKSIQTNSTVRYLSFYKRDKKHFDRYNIVNLNFSNA